MKSAIKNIVIGGIIASAASIVVGVVFSIGSVGLSFCSLILLGFIFSLIDAESY